MEGFTITTSGAMLSPVTLFLQADIVVKAVMLGLIFASIWTWAIILSHSARLRKISKASDGFERDFWKAEDIDRFYDGPGRADIPSAKIFSAGVAEWRRSTGGKTVDREGTRARLATAMGAAVASSRRWARSLLSSGCSAPSGASCAASPISPPRRTPVWAS
jgi:biopolymer transport protein TolQ